MFLLTTMDKLLFKNKWINVYETKQGFIYAQRQSINSTATLLFKKVNNNPQFLLRYQPLPSLVVNKKTTKCHSLFPCCVTGGIEPNETPIINAIKEVYEETNYIINSKNFIAKNVLVASTQMNELVYVFVVDITNCKQVKKTPGDGSIFETLSKNRWVSETKLKKILTGTNNVFLSSLASAYILFKKHI